MVEIDSMLEAQWRDGMLPHVRYDERFLADYFPGPDWWPRAAAHVRAPGLLTSGISNPPILPLAVRIVGERQPDRGRRHELWRRAVPQLAGWLRWFLDSRRPSGSGLPVVVHPWEAGWDNSPRWDALGRAALKPARHYARLDTKHVGATERPSGRDYDSYLALAEMLDSADYNLDSYLQASPFAVHDVQVDALWYRAALDVNEMAAAAGETAAFSARELEEYSHEFAAFHAGGYDWDVVAGRPIAVQTAAGVASLAGGLLPSDQAVGLWSRYEAACAGARLVPTVPPTAPEFEPARYWRGPVWLNVNWLVARGLAAAGLDAGAERVRGEGLELVERSGFFEYFDAVSGQGRGIDGFTWTAALVLDWLVPL